MSSDQMPAPGKLKLIKFLPPGQEKTSNAWGMPGGGMLKLRFDWYITDISFSLCVCPVNIDSEYGLNIVKVAVVL